MTAEEINRLALEIAVDSCWSAIECDSLPVVEAGVEWKDVGDDIHHLTDEFTLLTELKLAEVHPQHPEWIREVAEL